MESIENSSALTEALNRAWDQFLKAGLLTRHNLNTAKPALRLAILDIAAEGESNAWRLARTANARMAWYEPIVQERMQRSLRGVSAAA